MGSCRTPRSPAGWPRGRSVLDINCIPVLAPSDALVADRRRTRHRKRALYLAVGAYLLVVVGIVFAAPELLASVLIGGVGRVLGIGVGTAVAVSALR
jgi:hypothetical protein